MKVVSGHVPEEQIEQYAMGKLSLNCCDALEEHLLICESCQLSLEEIDTYLTHVKVASARMLVAQERPSRWDTIRGGVFQWMSKPLPAFAGLACVAVGVVFVLTLPRPAMQVPQKVTLESSRGGQLELPLVQAGRAIQFSLDATGLPESPSYLVNIVDESGKLVYETTAIRSQDQQNVVVRADSGLPVGKFLVRILDSKLQPLREYAVSIK